MTREDFEIQLHIRLDDLTCNVNNEYVSRAAAKDERDFAYESILNLIDNYYISNKACENCKYWNVNEECKLLVYDDDRCMTTSPSFSCSQWESKDD
jgi:hypothetical protein